MATKKPKTTSRKKSDEKPRVAKPERGARTMKDVSPAVRRELNAGTREAKTLVEILVVDFAVLLEAVGGFPANAIEQMQGAEGRGPHPSADAKRLGITQRMELGGRLLDEHARKRVASLAGHTSDTVRGWAAYAMARREGRTLAQRIEALRKLADDPNPGVREWAWLAVRPAIVASPHEAIDLLTPWTKSASDNLRRFASEATRPRGVWCEHIDALKREPASGLAILEPLRADSSRYVQNSVANWLNDASKSRADFVREVTKRWLREEKGQRRTEYVCRRALRSID